MKTDNEKALSRIADALQFQAEAGLIKNPESALDVMFAANEFCETNGQQPVFAPVEIQFQTFLDRVELTQRERDLLYVSNFFCYVFQTLHFDIAIAGKTPSPHDANLIKQTYASLVRLGQERTLTDNIRKPLIAKWCM